MTPIFAVHLGASTSAVISKDGEILQTYDFENRLGNDVERLPNDEFLGIFKPTTKTNISFGGSGGVHRNVQTCKSMPLIQVQNSPITIWSDCQMAI